MWVGGAGVDVIIPLRVPISRPSARVYLDLCSARTSPSLLSSDRLVNKTAFDIPILYVFVIVDKNKRLVGLIIDLIR
jgi:hypothetical protein